METQNTEYKLQWKDEFLKEICAFANAQGGTLYIGIGDNGDTIGVADAKSLLDTLPNKVRDTLGIVVDVRLQRRDNKDIVSVAVEQSSVCLCRSSSQLSEAWR